MRRMSRDDIVEWTKHFREANNNKEYTTDVVYFCNHWVSADDNCMEDRPCIFTVSDLEKYKGRNMYSRIACDTCQLPESKIKKCLVVVDRYKTEW